MYIVTERLATDMLEMILNGKPPRLSERVSKFIAYQVKVLNFQKVIINYYFFLKIMIALDLLHNRHIAHCDLKPENILLTENVEFPHVSKTLIR